MEIFKSAAGVDITHVPYKVATQASQDVMGGQTPLAMAALPSVIAHLRGGMLHAVAMTSEKRWASFPEVPTAAESGVPGYSHLTWIGIVVPTGTPAAIVARDTAATTGRSQATAAVRTPVPRRYTAGTTG